MKAPFPYFGGKRSIAHVVWQALGDVKQYVEPFCGSAAVLLECPRPASLEVIGDQSRYIANFWRSVKFQPSEVARWADYPVSHIDLAARHWWLTDQHRTSELDVNLSDPEWPGDAKIAGWWVWGQCAWIGSGWCERPINRGGVQSQIPHVSDAGRGVRSKVPHVCTPGMGILSHSDVSRGEHIRKIMEDLARRLDDVRIIHGSWDRCLNVFYGDKGRRAGIFFDPPYISFEKLYCRGANLPVAHEVARWASERGDVVRIVLCGHVGDYESILPGDWKILRWSRVRPTYKGGKTADMEALYLSPACQDVEGQERIGEDEEQICEDGEVFLGRPSGG